MDSHSSATLELISPSNHFTFTPLIPSTAVGTLEFRAIQECVRTLPSVKVRRVHPKKAPSLLMYYYYN
jgi:NADH dehydrogenase/NADH:ubiquinone reductase (non-electrogenic)